MHGVLGHAYYTRGAYVEARKHYDLQFAMLTATRTPDHPDLAAALGNMGMLSTVAGDSEGAEEMLRRSLALYESGYGPGHVETSQALYNLAVLLEMRKKYDEALPLAERALVILRAELGPEHPRALSQTAVQGRILSALGRNDEARRVLVDAVATIDRTLGPEHDALLYPLGVLMELEQSEGNDEAALAAATRAHKVALRAGRIDLAATFSESVGRALVRLGRTRPARDAFDEAVRLHEQTQGNPRAHAVVLRRRAALRVSDDAEGAAEDLFRALALLERDETPEVTRMVPVLVAQAQLFAQAGQTADAEAAVIRAEGLVLREPEDSVARAIAKFARAQRDFPTRPQAALASAREVETVLEASTRDEAVEVLPAVRAFLAQSESSTDPGPRH
jgi:tetratricopeptide (TPR) repeat protein